MNRLCIFAHYDRDNLIDDYVWYYVENLKKVSSQFVFVTTSRIADGDIAKLKTVCDSVTIRENEGYDFVSWQTGLKSIANIGDFDEVIFCNDSVYGPLYPLQNIFDGMRKKDCDFWGMTQSYDRAYHLQSYFIVFKEKVIVSNAFRDFWDSVRVEKNKQKIINKYEIGLTQALLSAGFKPSAYVTYLPSPVKKLSIVAGSALRNPARALRKVFELPRIIAGLNDQSGNPSHLLWKELIVTCRMPFVKVELLRDNPSRINIKGYEDILRKHTDYDVSLIRNHLERMRRTATS